MQAAASDVAAYATAAGAHVLILSEIHLAPGQVADIPGFTLLWQPRLAMVGHAPAGGVALAIKRDSQLVQAAEVITAFPRADVLWIRIQLSVMHAARPLFIAATYLPPAGVEHCCAGCGTTACSKAHVQEALAYLAETVARFSTMGEVVVAGDFNVRADAMPITPRWREVQHWLVWGTAPGGPQLCKVANPVDVNGCLLPTRQGTSMHNGTPVQHCSVLDLVLVANSNASTTAVTVVDTAAVSDHFPLNLCIDLCLSAAPGRAATGGQGGTTGRGPGGLDNSNSSGSGQPPNTQAEGTAGGGFPWSAQFGQDTDVPRPLRGRVRVPVGRAAVPPNVYTTAVARHLQDVTNQHRTALPALSQAMWQAAHDTGALSKQQDMTVRVFALTQRKLEQARKSVARLTALAQEGVEDAAAKLAIAQQRRAALEAQRRAELPQRRAAQRVRTQQAQCAMRTALWRQWKGDNAAAMAELKRRQRTHAGERHKTVRPLVPLQLRQQALWDRLCFLRTKYGCQANTMTTILPPSPGAPVDSHPASAPPTVEEVEVALGKLSPTSAALGIPAALLRMLRVSPATLTRVHTILAAVWSTGDIPEEWGLVEAVAIPKPPPNHASFRVLGVGTALARLFRLLMLQRMMPLVAPRLSPSQFGFLPGLSTDHASFVANGVVQVSQALGTTVLSTYLDIAGAYPSTKWEHVQQRLEALGVPPHLRLLNQRWYCKQRMFCRVGRLCSPSFPVTIGLTEGDPLSPLLFIATIDAAVQQLQQVALRSGHLLGAGLPLPLGTCTDTWYADDGRLVARSVAGMQALLDACTAHFSALDFTFNAAPTKSAVQLHPPRPKRRRVAVPPGASGLLLQGAVLPPAPTYKHLGITIAAAGGRATTAAHVQRLQMVAATITRQAAGGGVAGLTPLLLLRVYTTFWLPKLLWGAAHVLDTPPPVLQQLESRLLRMAFSAGNHPLVVLRATVGLPTWQTRLDLARLRLLLRLLAMPPAHTVRQVLALQVHTHQRLLARGTAVDAAASRQLWWNRTAVLLRTLDVVAPDIRPAASSEDNWEQWACHGALAWQQPVQVTQEVQRQLHTALQAVENRRRRWEVERVRASVGEVQDLVDSPNAAPWTMVPLPDWHIQLLVGVSGGRRTLFGHAHFHLLTCPMCDLAGAFTLPHLLRDCPHWEAHRLRTWQRAQATAAAVGAADSLPNTGEVWTTLQVRDMWYRVMCGAAVPHSCLRLHLDRQTHVARSEERGSAVTPTGVPHHVVYRRLLVVTGRLLRQVVMDVQTRLAAAPGPTWEYSESADAPRVSINHVAREEAAVAGKQ